ncbi:pyridoxal-phosphate-dependent aminotransferase family protein [Virgibacillus soli]
MLTEQQILRIPGPTPIHPSIQRAMNQSMIGHRDQATSKLLEKISPRLKPVFGTKQDVLLIAGSGTAGLEAAVTNCVQPGDEVLVAVSGAFGERFAEICEAYRITTHRIKTIWGKSVDPDEIKDFLQRNNQIKAVFFTHCETSTGVLNPIQALSQIVRSYSDALIIVDGVSSIGATEMNMDDWGIDLLVTGSQKAFMLPPGLTMVAASERAWEIIQNNTSPKFYFDFRMYHKQLANNTTPFTPVISLIFGLEQVLTLLEKEGLQQVYHRHQLMKTMTRAAFQALDIPLLTDDVHASPTVTAVRPTDFSANTLRQVVKKEFGLILAGGQQQLKDKIFRIGHMGYCYPADVLQYVAIIELGMKRIGKSIPYGQGVRAAQEVYVTQTKLAQ